MSFPPSLTISETKESLNGKPIKRILSNLRNESAKLTPSNLYAIFGLADVAGMTVVGKEKS